MRTASIEINGKSHLLCFSLRVMRACADRYGSVKNIFSAMSGENEAKVLDETFWILAAMMDGGDRYARLNEIENPKPYSSGELMDLFDISDLSGLRGKIIETVAAGSRPTIEAEPPKNVETTLGES